MEVGKYIDFHQYHTGTNDFDIRLTCSGSTLNCSGTFTQGSDKNLKKDIRYINEDTKLLKTKEKTPFKDFIKDFKFATFKYLDSDKTNFGFIAQDIEQSEVGKLMLTEYDREILDKKKEKVIDIVRTLSFDISGYTSVVAKALQETINELDELKIENQELKNKINEIEKRLEEK